MTIVKSLQTMIINQKALRVTIMMSDYQYNRITNNYHLFTSNNCHIMGSMTIIGNTIWITTYTPA